MYRHTCTLTIDSEKPIEEVHLAIKEKLEEVTEVDCDLDYEFSQKWDEETGDFTDHE